MSAAHHIFHDPSGRRRFVAKLFLLALITLLVVLTYYAYDLFHRIPVMAVPEEFQDTTEELRQQKQVKLSQQLLSRSLQELQKEVKETELLSKRQGAAANRDSQAARIWALFEPGSENAFYSFRFNVERITDLVMTTLAVGDSGSLLESDLHLVAQQQIKETQALAQRHEVRIFGRITNDSPDGYSEQLILNLIENSSVQQQFMNEMLGWMQRHDNYAGLLFDFRSLSKETYFKLIPFFSELRTFWGEHLQKYELGIIFPGATIEMPLWKFGSLFDVALMRAFGQNLERQTVGPVAASKWFADAVQFALNNIPPYKLGVLFDNSAIDWTVSGEQSSYIERSFLSAMTLARDIAGNRSAADVILLDPTSLNNYFGYIDAENREHQVWFSDAVNAFNQYTIADRAGLKHFGTFSLGIEDPGLWSFLAKDPNEVSTRSGLSRIEFPFGIQFEGRGDILKPKAELRPGSRNLHFDPKTGLISNSSYQKFPAAVIVDRQGYKPKTLALTFDDGPSAEFTPEILDLLKQHQVKATFFVNGESVQEETPLLRRIYAEGHDIGNNSFTHPDLSLVSRQRLLLELNSTNRLIQSVLGRSTLLFRPPYLSEGAPASLREVRVLEEAKRLNYVVVGVSLDPQDWKLEKINSEGLEVARTAQDLVQDTLSRLDQLEGNVILFHDGKNDRENTVAALRILIPELKMLGYKLESISSILELPRDQVMPKVSEQELVLGGVSRVYIEVIFFFKSLLQVVFIVVAAFGVLRLLSFIGLSVWSVRHEQVFKPEQKYFNPPVSIIVAAYNEEKVIERTIRSLLAARYPEFEIIVVDDGSSDRTSEVVQEHFLNHPKVQLIKKENGGKSSALNVGIERAKYEIIVGLDADTQYSPDAIAAMARHFQDPKVAAVAGNVKVGNRDSVLLQCQSIEYITNQNFGRRAFAVVDAITVVPGAAGAWRKSAVVEVGNYLSDTLGEDMELTWRIRKAGYAIAFEPRAYAFTEAPATLSGVFKQRFRWIYGQIQILWKHRDVFFNPEYKWFGWFGTPLLVLDDIFLFLAPLADLQALIAVGTFVTFLSSSSLMSPEAVANFAPLSLFIKSMIVYAVFFATEVLCAVYAFKLDREPLRPIWLLFVKQFFYRQLMYVVTYKALWRALTGWKQNWGVLHRTGTVEISSDAKKPS
jgi:poly-beta-1,6 N-acetyl-D-glucosamine synthase